MSAIFKGVISSEVHPCYDVVLKDGCLHKVYKVRICALLSFIRDMLPLGCTIEILGKSRGDFPLCTVAYEVLPF